MSSKVEVDGWEFWVHQGNSRVGLVLVHEIFGHDEYIESVASKLAEEGFSAAAVDLYRGEHASSLERLQNPGFLERGRSGRRSPIG